MKYKIIFIIPSLAGGGAERVFANIINTIDKGKFDVTLVQLSDERQVYAIRKDVCIINLGVKRLRNAPLKLLKIIRAEKPDLIVSTLGHMNLLLSLLKPFFPKKTKLIVRQTSIPSYSMSDKKFTSLLQKKAIGFLNRADKIICQSELMKNEMNYYLSASKHKTKKIFNPVNIRQIEEKSIEPIDFVFKKNYKYLIFIGRLDKVKRIHLIIEAYEKYYKINKRSKLLIIGTGPLEGEIKQLIENKLLSNHIQLLGYQRNPYKWLKHCDLFILASRHEGMPNVLLEALTLKIPVLVKSHPGGTVDILKTLNLETRFVDKLNITDNHFTDYPNNILVDIEKNFGINSITEKYEKLFISVIEEG